MRQQAYRAALGLLVAGVGAGLILILGTSFLEASARPGRADAPVPLLPYPLFIGLLVVLAGGVAVAAVWFLVALVRDQERTSPRRSGEMLALVGGVIGALLVVFVVSGVVLSLMEMPDEPDRIPMELGDGEAEPETADADRQPYEPEPEPTEVEPRERSGLVVVIASVLATAIAVVLALVVWRRYAGRPQADEREELDRLSTDLHRASGRGLERMLEEPDHRRAVIAAYALVEDTLERHGFPHGRGDTPVEFMRATLERLAERSRQSGAPDVGRAYERSSRALLALTRLYEVAKFSEHPVSERERAEAVESLEHIGAAVASSTGRAEREGGGA